MSIKLNIKIDTKGRQFLQDNDENIILVFPSDEESEFSIVCISFFPFGDSNQVEFFNDYYLYGTSQDIVSFDVVKFNEQVAVNYGDIYRFDGVSFTYGSQAYSNDVCGISNKSPNNQNLTSGIAQKINVANIEDPSPIFIGSVPQNQITYFDSTNVVRIFVAKGIFSNMIIPNDILTPVVIGGMKKISKNTKPRLTVGDYLEIDLQETTTVVFDITINAFRK